MARKQIRRTAALAFDAITVEGALLAPAILARIAQHQADGQSEADYGVPKGLTLREEIARYFRIGQALFIELSASKTPSHTATIGFTERLLRDVLGFNDVQRVGTRTLGDRQFAVTLEGLSGRVPIVVVPPSDDLDHLSDHLPSDGRRRSAASAIQDWLNASEGARWGLCSNGVQLRLARGNASLTRPAHIEADLRRMFEGEAFADFALLWLLVHASRFGVAGTPPSDCALERWRDAGQRDGLAARDRLRDGVETALLSLGGGFLSHSDNAPLRERLHNGKLALPEFFGQLLRLVYRLIFLLAAENRDLLHPPGATAAACKLYAEGYAVGALRDRAVRRGGWDRHHDRWEGLLITFACLARGEPRLGLPALDGLFAHGTLPDLENAKLANRSLMEAIYRLAWLKDDSGLVPVNWRDMETEELGSVYESLLELTPRLTDEGRGFAFAEGGESKGHARKTTGSYYTPDSLVQTLLDSALDPVLDRVEAEADDPAAALLSVTVIDPACGSGHFLLAAARRIATRLARARAGGVASPADYRHALRDVARACIHGIDRNPMAVELTKVALWIETVEPGKPLGFLDANIRCGDSLLGVLSLKALRRGVPDAAYKPLAGDDKDAAKIAGRINREQRESVAQQELALTQGAANFVRAARAIIAMPEDDLAGVQARARAYATVHADRGWWATKTACDLYVAAFLAPKHLRSGALARAQTPDRIPTTLDVRTAVDGRQPDAQLVAKAVELAGSARAFHWPVEFPAIMATGGFDVVLGNPPWDRIKLQEQEFFAAREPEIAQAPNAAARARLIARLKDAKPGTREHALYEEFETAKRTTEAASIFARVASEDGGRFPLTGHGDVNTYALFAELFACVASKRGRAGVIVPTGIATDATTAKFFGALLQEKRLINLHDFQTGLGYFDRIGHARFKFCLLTLGQPGTGPEQVEFSFFSRTSQEFADRRRHFTLSRAAISQINPNTVTAPIFRTTTDAELTAAIHRRVPVLIDEAKARTVILGAYRSWPCFTWRTIVAFFERPCSCTRAALFATATTGSHPTPRYWVPEREVAERLAAKSWKRGWLMGWRDIARATDERTLISGIIPQCGSGHKFLLMFPSESVAKCAALYCSLNSIACDYFARQKLGGTSFTYFTMKQIPVLQPSSYLTPDLAFIVPRVLELTYTSHSMAPFARDLGYDGAPFAWNEDRRAQLRAELDAWYARAYGLTRDELRYILDPADVKGPDYPSETFRVLKKNEIARLGEYRTARLVLQAWDRMERGELAA
jgi:N-6 DNA Methylase